MDAERKPHTHQAATHNAWFLQQVELAVQEADDPHAEWDSQAEVKRKSKIKRAVWLGESPAAERAAG